jgi:hypothetical protein
MIKKRICSRYRALGGKIKGGKGAARSHIVLVLVGIVKTQETYAMPACETPTPSRVRFARVWHSSLGGDTQTATSRTEFTLPQEPRLFALPVVDECNRDVSTVTHTLGFSKGTNKAAS